MTRSLTTSRTCCAGGGSRSSPRMSGAWAGSRRSGQGSVLCSPDAPAGRLTGVTTRPTCRRPDRTGIDLICVAERQQGIVSREGLTLADLPVRQFINRQKGSGTRMLLDYESRPDGYRSLHHPGIREGGDHPHRCGSCGESGEAHAGMCVYSAARELWAPVRAGCNGAGPVGYQAGTCTGSPGRTSWWKMIRSRNSWAVLEKLGGYDTKETGLQRMVS